MNVQTMIDAMLKSGELERSKYHLTLGKLIKRLEELPAKKIVRYDDGEGPGEERSYRGYYSDLGFSDGDPVYADDLLKVCKKANGATYEGYKGGDYVMSDDTPLWRSEYGEAGGVAIVDIVEVQGNAILITKRVDD